ncbi:MAG: low molecular weight phosphotyrosine protein phosphatase [Bacteroidia bacterium]|nr:low molecular weight phosphotyrosine protein phosphatase [Bacteroidia bacterium]
MPAILFVCLGNICRSPMAEGVMNQLLRQNNIQNQVIDSAATLANHVGERPFSKTIAVCEKYGVKLNHFARKIQESDYQEFDFIFTMDNRIHKTVISLKPESCKSQIFLFREFDPLHNGDLETPDPYFGDIDDFENVYQICLRTCNEIIHKFL